MRAPNPTNFYIPKIITNEDIHADSASDSETELLHRKFESNNTQEAVVNKARERPKRRIKKPAENRHKKRYGLNSTNLSHNRKNVYLIKPHHLLTKYICYVCIVY